MSGVASSEQHQEQTMNGGNWSCLLNLQLLFKSVTEMENLLFPQLSARYRNILLFFWRLLNNPKCPKVAKINEEWATHCNVNICQKICQSKLSSVQIFFHVAPSLISLPGRIGLPAARNSTSSVICCVGERERAGRPLYVKLAGDGPSIHFRKTISHLNGTVSSLQIPFLSRAL